MLTDAPAVDDDEEDDKEDEDDGDDEAAVFSVEPRDSGKAGRAGKQF